MIGLVLAFDDGELPCVDLDPYASVFDAINNVTHVGHANPRVVAAHRQTQRLTTKKP